MASVSSWCRKYSMSGAFSHLSEISLYPKFLILKQDIGGVVQVVKSCLASVRAKPQFFK
jgi:hypothetical protein